MIFRSRVLQSVEPVSSGDAVRNGVLLAEQRRVVRGGEPIHGRHKTGGVLQSQARRIGWPGDDYPIPQRSNAEPRPIELGGETVEASIAGQTEAVKRGVARKKTGHVDITKPVHRHAVTAIIVGSA